MKPGLTRRSLLAGAGGAALVAPALARAQSLGSGGRVVVIGAGAFGAWTAEHLRRLGHHVLLVDAWGPAHARASSGDETRMTRGAYGKDEIYTRMALESLPEWKALSARAGLPIFHETGVLFFFDRIEPYFEQSLEVHRRLDLPTERLDRAALARRFPMIDFAGIEVGLFEPGFGALMARRSIQTLVAEYVRAGGRYERQAVAPPKATSGRLARVATLGGKPIEADRFVFACGPWLPKLFPELLRNRIFVTRQEVFFFAPGPGDTRFSPGRFPGWADFNRGDLYYGFPDLEARGVKIAHDQHGPRVDPDVIDRTPTPDRIADVRAYMARRFPGLAKARLNESRVCQYENSSNGDYLMDRHPELENVVLVGGGSGHGFKNGPAVGRYAAALITGTLAGAEPRFSLATKEETQARAVH